MSLKKIMASFTKSEIQSILKKLKDTEHRSSWKKTKLVDQVLKYSIEDILNKLTSKQLKEALELVNQSSTGTKSVRLDRLLQILIKPTQHNDSFTLSIEQQTKIIDLLKEGDEFLLQAEELLKSLIDNLDIYEVVHKVLDFGVPESYGSLFDFFERGKYKNPLEITKWVINLAENAGADWVKKRTRHFEFYMDGWRWDSVRETISKETYEFWQNSEVDLHDYVFYSADLDELARASIPEQHRFKAGGEFSNDFGEWFDFGLEEIGIFFDDYFEIIEKVGRHNFREYETNEGYQIKKPRYKKVPSKNPDDPETYWVIAREEAHEYEKYSGRSSYMYASFELKEDFDITKLKIWIGLDEIEGPYLINDAIEYDSADGTVTISPDFLGEHYYDVPRTVKLVKGSELLFYKEVESSEDSKH